MPTTIPHTFGDVATFSVSHTTDVSISHSVEIDSLVFAPDASAFTISVRPTMILTFLGAGLGNNSTVPQNFLTKTSSGSAHGSINFFNDAGPGPLMTFTNQGNTVDRFTYGAYTSFFGTGSASTATYVNQGGTVAGAFGGITLMASASSGAQATFISEPGTAAGAFGGVTFFTDTASGGNAVATSLGAAVAGANGGNVVFDVNSHASNATLIAEGGTNGGNGGSVILSQNGTGDFARVILHGNGFLDLTPSTASSVSIGSFEGDGVVVLNEAVPFSAGTNNLSTTFSGVIEDDNTTNEKGSAPGSTGNSFTKVGGGTLTLSGASTYTGGTTVGGGTLLISNTTGSGTGTGQMQVNAGTLGGSGTITGSVTVGTGSGTGASLAPAGGTGVQAALNLVGSLTFNTDATYTYTFKAKKKQAKADKVVASGVTINGGATFALSGLTQGTLTRGLILTVIRNTAATPIAGTFSNLPDGGIVNVNGNNLQADYEGGDGNDLTLTVVP